MKKILFILLCVLSFVGIVCADTQIEYEWGQFVGYSITNANIYKGQTSMIYYSDYSDSDWFFVLDELGKEKIRIESPEYDYSLYSCGLTRNFYIFEDFIISIDNLCDEHYQMVYDDELNIIDTIELPNWNNSIGDDMYGETDELYYIGNNFFDKKTKQPLNVNEVLSSDPLFEEVDSVCREFPNSDECTEKGLGVYERAYKGTFIPVFINYEFGLIDLENRQLSDIFINGYNGYAVSFYDESADKYGVEFYDVDMNVINTNLFDSYVEPYVLFKDNYFYIFEIKGKQLEDNEETYYFSVTEYDYKFNKRSEYDLSTLTKEEAINLEARAGRYFYNVLPVEDGFVMITKIGSGPLMIDENGRQNLYDSVQKYSFVYNVETKKNDNGTISVNKTSSKNGEIVTYNVEPKKGYKLEKVIVTDPAGNKIEIRGNSFTMPSTDVIVEAIFVVDNPNTNVFVGIAVTLFFLGACLVYVILRNVRVKQFQ